MRRRERFGKLVLIDELESVHLGATHLAARLGSSGLERLVTLLRFSDVLSQHPEAAGRLMDQTRRVARLGIKGLPQTLGIGRVGPSYYASYELTEGRSLRIVVDRARQEGFPFSMENALMVVSRAAAVLQALHERRDDEGAPLFHGLLTPVGLVVSWEGEVRLREVGLWPGLRGTALQEEIHEPRLAPEQREGGPGDTRADVHALGLVLLEMLTGWSPDGDTDPVQTASRASITTVTGEKEPLPEPIRETLLRALDPDASARYPDMAEMRRAIDALLFSGDFTPTTFNLAFFMQTLFREDMEREALLLTEAREADYTEFLPPPASPEAAAAAHPEAEAAAHPEAAAAAHPEAAASGKTPPDSTAVGATNAAGATAPEPTGVAPPTAPPERLTAPPPSSDRPPEGPTPTQERRLEPSGPSSSGRHHGPVRRRPPPPSASNRLLASASRPTGERRGLVLTVGIVLALLLGGGVGYLYHIGVSTPGTRPAGGLNPEAEAALARVRELEERLAELERQKAELEAAMEETAEAEGTAAAGEPGSPVAAARETTEAVISPSRVERNTSEAREAEEARARAQARRRALAERARRQEQIRQLEEEIQAAQSRLVTEQDSATLDLDLDSALKATSASLPTPEPLPPPTTQPPVVPGQLVSTDDPGVTNPVLLEEGPPVLYPAAARNLGRSAEVVVQALVSEEGQVLEAKALESSVAGLGFEAAAERKVQSHRYRPATKDGVPVRVRIQVQVRFTPW